MTIGQIYAKMNSREKVLLAVGFVFITLALMDRLVLGPILEELKILDSQIWTMKESLQRDLRIISFKESILKEYSKYELYLDSGDKTQEEIVAALLQMIENLARQNEITISNIQPGDVAQNAMYKEYLTRIECEGKLSNLVHFMDALEASDFLFRILKYDFTVKTKTGEILKAGIDVSRILIAAETLPEPASGPAKAQT